jgi:hypothetical protein
LNSCRKSSKPINRPRMPESVATRKTAENARSKTSRIATAVTEPIEVIEVIEAGPSNGEVDVVTAISTGTAEVVASEVAIGLAHLEIDSADETHTVATATTPEVEEAVAEMVVGMASPDADAALPDLSQPHRDLILVA